MTRAALADATAGNAHGASGSTRYAKEIFVTRTHLIHEGIDTQLAQPNPAGKFACGDHAVDRSVPTITLVNRGLERLRGFDVFMRALPSILSSHPYSGF